MSTRLYQISKPNQDRGYKNETIDALANCIFCNYVIQFNFCVRKQNGWHNYFSEADEELQFFRKTTWWWRIMVHYAELVYYVVSLLTLTWFCTSHLLAESCNAISRFMNVWEFAFEYYTVIAITSKNIYKWCLLLLTWYSLNKWYRFWVDNRSVI